jgi:hypothetical protein
VKTPDGLQDIALIAQDVANKLQAEFLFSLSRFD